MRAQIIFAQGVMAPRSSAEGGRDMVVTVEVWGRAPVPNRKVGKKSIQNSQLDMPSGKFRPLMPAEPMMENAKNDYKSGTIVFTGGTTLLLP
jgi:hypothetical protein